MRPYFSGNSAGLALQADDRLKQFALFLGKLLLFALPLLIYLRTMAPTVYALDSAELATGAYSLGIIHATGYPLYLLLGHLFTYLPWGDIGFRLNLMSALFGYLTLLLLYHLLRRFAVRPALALLATLALAFSYYFWALNLMAEVYTLHTFLMVAQLVCLKHGEETQQDRWLYGLAGLSGLSLGNHLTIGLGMPGIAYLIFRCRPELLRAWGKLAWMVVFFSLGASIYIYIPLRFLADPVMNYPQDYYQVDLTTWQGMGWLLSGQMFDSAFFAYSLAEMPRELLLFGHRLLGNFLGWGVAVGSIGLSAGFRRWPGWRIGTSLIFIANAIFFINYRVDDKETMFLPLFLIWAFWLGLGLEVLYRWFGPARRPRRHLVFGGLGLVLIGGTLVLNYPRVDLSHDWRTRRQAEKIMQTLEPEAYFIGRWGYVPTLEYLQIVEGRRPDVRLVHRVLLPPEQLLALVEAKIDRHPLYFSDVEPLLTGQYRFKFVKDCACFKLARKGSPLDLRSSPAWRFSFPEGIWLETILLIGRKEGIYELSSQEVETHWPGPGGHLYSYHR